MVASYLVSDDLKMSDRLECGPVDAAVLFLNGGWAGRIQDVRNTAARFWFLTDGQLQEVDIVDFSILQFNTQPLTDVIVTETSCIHWHCQAFLAQTARHGRRPLHSEKPRRARLCRAPTIIRRWLRRSRGRLQNGRLWRRLRP